ncbi:unnamed protein product, partial [Discosporangium mesarthrocarpum]
ILLRASEGLKHPCAQETLPTWAQMARFAAAFNPPPPGVKAALAPSAVGRGGSGAWGGGGGGWEVAGGRGKSRGRAIGGTEPVLPDEAMSKAFNTFRSFNIGEQEDAQEFLAFFLDQLHEEVVKAKKQMPSLQHLSHGAGHKSGP